MTPPVDDEEAATRIAPGRSFVSDELRRELDREAIDAFEAVDADERKRPTLPPAAPAAPAAPRGPSSHPAPPLVVASEVPRGMPRVVIASLIVSAILTAAGLWALAYLKGEGYW